jgi:hypothetical protein
MRIISISLCVLGLVFGLAACSQTMVDVSNQALLPAVALDSQPTAIPTLDDSLEVVVLEPKPVNECLACHSDKELLIEIAEPEQETESESKGTG